MIAEIEPKTETGLVLFSIDDIKPAPENDTLYRPIDPADPEIIALAESICGLGLWNRQETPYTGCNQKDLISRGER